MKYTILIHETPDDFATRLDPARQPDYSAAWQRYTKALMEAGIFEGGAGLQSPAIATTLRFEGDKRLVQDGPFADTREQLGGFYLINVADLDTALDWAAKCPRTPGRVLEIRPTL